MLVSGRARARVCVVRCFDWVWCVVALVAGRGGFGGAERQGRGILERYDTSTISDHQSSRPHPSGNRSRTGAISVQESSSRFYITLDISPVLALTPCCPIV